MTVLHLRIILTDSNYFDEHLKFDCQQGTEKLFTYVLGHTPSAAGRAIAMIDLAGGWDTFVERVKIDLFVNSKNSKEKMKKQIHLVFLLIGCIISVCFFDGWENFFGYLGFLLFFVWNIYAYKNVKNMISLPMMAENVKIDGNSSARLFLFLFSLIMPIILFSGYIYKSIDA